LPATFCAQNGLTALSIAQRLGYISVVEILRRVTDVTVTPAVTEDKYKVTAPETMQEAPMSDSEEEGGQYFSRLHVLLFLLRLYVKIKHLFLFHILIFHFGFEGFNSRALYGTISRPSVVCLSSVCLTYVLRLNGTSYQKNCLKKWITLPGRYLVVPCNHSLTPRSDTNCTI